jgi:hypothetical protein
VAVVRDKRTWKENKEGSPDAGEIESTAQARVPFFPTPTQILLIKVVSSPPDLLSVRRIPLQDNPKVGTLPWICRINHSPVKVTHKLRN